MKRNYGEIKFGFITDTHVDNKYDNRLDDAQASILYKIKQCYAIAEKNNCDFMLHGGDVFNRPSIKEKKNDIFNRLRKIIVDAKINSYFILGQHDVNYSFDCYKDSTLKMLSGSCDGKFELIEDYITINGVNIYASHVYQNIQDRINEVKQNCNANILVAHCLLYDKPKMFETIPIKDIKSDNVNLILSGDLHCGFEFQKQDNTYFYNPGSLLRKAKDQKDRKPKFAIFSISEFFGDYQIEIKEFELDCLDGDSCFDLSEEIKAKVSIALENNTEDKNIKEFAQEAVSFKAKNIDIFEFIYQESVKNNLDQKITNNILSYRDKIETE